MEPITLAVLAIGAGLFLAMIFFLIDYIGTLIEVLNEARDRTIEAQARVDEMMEEYQSKLDMENTRQSEKRVYEEKINRLNYLRTKLNALESKYDKNAIIFDLIDAIIGGGPAKITLGIARLVELIRSSFFYLKI
jgi:hypothetical protein